jgi:hypothetical protein
MQVDIVPREDMKQEGETSSLAAGPNPALSNVPRPSVGAPLPTPGISAAPNAMGKIIVWLHFTLNFNLLLSFHWHEIADFSSTAQKTETNILWLQVKCSFPSPLAYPTCPLILLCFNISNSIS